MKTIATTIILTLSVISIFTGCERNNYKHPMYRSK